MCFLYLVHITDCMYRGCFRASALRSSVHLVLPVLHLRRSSCRPHNEQEMAKSKTTFPIEGFSRLRLITTAFKSPVIYLGRNKVYKTGAKETQCSSVLSESYPIARSSGSLRHWSQKGRLNQPPLCFFSMSRPMKCRTADDWSPNRLQVRLT